MRGVPVYSQMKGLRVDLADIRSRVNDRTKLICLCNPNNPTGDALPPGEMRAFLRDLPDDVLVLLDEAYVDFTEPSSRLDSVGVFRGGMDNLFILRSFSKIYGLAGLRFGCGIGHESLISLINRIKPPFDVSILAEQAAIDALEDEEFYHRSVKECRSEKRLFYRRLDALGLAYTPSHTNFVLIDTGQDAQDLSRALLRRGIIVRSAASYGLPGHIRVTIGRHGDNERFFDALETVLRENSSS
jgi:histidinol-phosphate aminotransferase